jgi:hypothetical protein
MRRGLALTALVVLCASPVGAAPRIVNGTLTSLYPTTGALLVSGDPATASLECSGTLIGCQTFLTAGHCVCDTVGSNCQGANAPNPAGFVVFLQHAGFFSVASISVHPSYDFPVGDVAIVHLATPVTGIAPTPIDTTVAPPDGTDALIAGFGRSGGNRFDYGLKRAGAVVTAPCPAGVSGTTSVCFDFADPVGPPGTDVDTCNGDSGGPLFVDFGCGLTVAGITSGGTSSPCLPTDHSYDANVYDYRDYVAAQAGADLANRTCGAMPQAGDAKAPITGFDGTLDATTSQATHAFTVPAGTSRLRVAMNAIDDGGSDFDLYVRRGSPPTTSVFDCKQDGFGQFGFCEFTAPAAGTWYALVVRSFGAGDYQVTVTTIGTGAPGSGGDGAPCDDLNPCTTTDVCQAGRCAGTPAANGAPCDDGRRCTGPDVCQAGVCTAPPAPIASCQQPLAPGKASLVLRDSTHDQISWKWSAGSAITPADVGSPTTSSTYELCIFDQIAGTNHLVYDARIPPGPSWSPYSQGYRYRDKLGTSGGLSSIVLKEGDAGRASITLKGKGTDLPIPPLPLSQDPTVRVQLLNENACWEARYGTSQTNQTGLFRARSD